VTAVNVDTTGTHGTVSLNTDGSFTFTPETGFTGLTTFAYTARDADNLNSVVTGTVTLNVSGLVWYVDSAYAGGGNDGSFNKPFTTLAPLNTGGDPDGAGQTIFVYDRGTAYTGGITLEGTQTLQGTGDSLTVNGMTIAATTKPTITNAAGAGVTLANGNTVRGVAIGSTTTAGILGSGVADGTISNVAITAGVVGVSLVTGSTGTFTFDPSTSIAGVTGTAFNVQGGSASITYSGSLSESGTGGCIAVDGHSTGTITFQTGAISSSGGGVGISVTNSTGGTYNFNNASITLNTGTSKGVNLLSGNSATANFGGGLDIDTTSGIGFDSQQWGTLTVSGAGTKTIDTTTGTAINISTVGAGASGIAFTSVNTNSAANGILINALTGSGAFSVTSGAIVNASTRGVDISGGSTNISYGGTISTTGVAARSVEVTGRTAGTITFSGNITDTSTGINVASNTGGTIAFSGATKTLNTGANTAATLSGNTGATINFTGGGLDIDTTSSTGFSATGGGTISVTGSGNTITSPNATALNVANTTIGASDLNFQSIASGNNDAGADPVSGIILNATGSSGGLTITGTGAADSGGIIQHTTGSAIAATDTQDLSLTRIKIDVPGNHGIDAQNLRGTGMLANSSILDWTSAIGDGVSIVNNNANLTLFTITGTTFNGTDTSRNGVLMEAQGTSNMVLSVEGNSLFTDMFGNGVLVSSIGGSTGTVRATVKDSTFNNSTFNNAAVLGNGGISLTPFGGVNFFALIDNNTMDTIMRPVSNAGAIGMTNGSTANADITVQNNTLNDIIGARGITITADGTGATRLLFDNNNIDRLGSSSKSAISVNLAGATTTADVTVRNNDIGTAAALFSVASGASDVVLFTAQQGTKLTALIQDNVITANTSLEVLRVRAISTATLNATVTGNTLTDTAGSHIEFEAATGTGGVVGGTINLNISGNILPAAGVGVIRITENAAPGDINVTQASAAAVAAANSAATVTVTGAPDFGQPAPPTPTLPTLPLLFAPGGVEALPSAAGPATADIAMDSPPAPCATGSASAAPGGLTDDVVAPSISIMEHTGGASGTQVVVDDGMLSSDELDFIVTAAAAHWAATGLSAEQSAALANTTFTVSSLPGWYLGSASGNQIQIDTDGGGFGWFIDSTPLDDSEFPNASSETRLYTNSTLAPAGKIDLLTTVMHEMGHILGLGDSYSAADRESLLYGYATVGERRLPATGQADGAVPGSIDHEEFLVGPLKIGTLPAGKEVRVTFQVTINNLTNGLAPTISNQGTVSGGNFANVLTDDPSAGGSSDPTNTSLDSLTLGNQVWIEANGNSVFNSGTDTVVNNVALTLFLSDGTTQVTTTTTNASGVFQFSGLLPGDYIVRVDASNFGGGQPLAGLLSIIGSTDPDNNIDNDDNGVDDAAPATNGIRSLPITLAYNTEPTAGVGNDTNNTLDFGIVAALPTVNLSVSANAGTEVGVTAITVTATSSSAVVGNKTVDLAVTGIGITAGDYSLSAAQITILNGATTGSVTFTVQNDAVVELLETAILTISNPSAGITLGPTVSQNVAITDNDTATFTIDDVTVNEADGTMTFTVSLSNLIDIPIAIKVDYTDVSATGGGTDYDSAQDTVTFAALSTTPQTVTVAISEDFLVEGNETFTASLSTTTALGGRSVSLSDTGTGTITDNDAAIGNFVFDDANGDGLQTGDTGRDGVTVNLLNAAGDTQLDTTVTAGGGLYSFIVAPGTYIIEFVAPPGRQFSPQDVPGDDTIDSDANTSNGRTATITVVAGQNQDTVDAGLKVITPQLNAIDVQNGQTQRSFVRNLDLVFSSNSGLFALIDGGRVRLIRFDLDGNNPALISLGNASVVGNNIRLDFGVQGIGGNRNSNAGDGYYEISVDTDSNGSFESKKNFFRLFGDVTGDAKVNASDKIQILQANGTASVESDVNGDGLVNVLDTALMSRAVGKKLKSGLFWDD